MAFRGALSARPLTNKSQQDIILLLQAVPKFRDMGHDAFFVCSAIA
jgi:hypothetical protein